MAIVEGRNNWLGVLKTPTSVYTHTQVTVREGMSVYDSLDKALKVRGLNQDCCVVYRLIKGRKTVTAWDTAIAPLDGEELIVEVLEDVPLTMHNFVSLMGMVEEATVWTERALSQACTSLLCGCRYGRHSSAWPSVTSALSFCSMDSAARPVATSSTSIVPPRSPPSALT